MESPSGRKSRSSLTLTLRSSAAGPASYILWKITRMFSTHTNRKNNVAAVAFLDSPVLRMGRAEGQSPTAFLILPSRVGDTGLTQPNTSQVADLIPTNGL